MPQDEGNPAAIALEINAQSARRAFSADVEHGRILCRTKKGLFRGFFIVYVYLPQKYGRTL